MERSLAIKKWDWKTWALVAFGSAAVVASAAFLMQSKHAALGRQVHRNVTRFLVNQGSQVHSGIISGGLVSTPMKTSTAVNSTIISMLNTYEDMISQNPAMASGSPDMQQEQQMTTGVGGVQGRSQQGTGSALRPPPGSPQPVSASGSIKAPASIVVNPTDRIRGEANDWASKTGREATTPPGEYNPEEFTPRGPKPSGDADLFAGDGIPSGGSVPAKQAPVSGYE